MTGKLVRADLLAARISHELNKAAAAMGEAQRDLDRLMRLLDDIGKKTRARDYRGDLPPTQETDP